MANNLDVVKIEDKFVTFSSDPISRNPILRNFFDKLLEIKDVNLKENTKKIISDPISCNICLKIFPAKSTLQLHKEIVHECDAKFFFCDQCPKAFESKNGLEKHLRRHTGEGFNVLFSCESKEKFSKEKLENVDPKDFMINKYSEEISFLSNLKNNFEVNFFPCNQCPKAFEIENNLEKDVKRHTGDFKSNKYSGDEEFFIGIGFILKQCNLKNHLEIKLEKNNLVEQRKVYEDKNTLGYIQNKIFQVF